MGPTKISPEDQSFNITFVSEVQQYPCLYDSGNPEYKQQVLQERAWQKVSDAVGEGVDTCKKRWRNLRCCMTRYQKSLRDNNDQARRKPYYLYSHMQFVLPYLKARDDNSTYEPDDPSWTKAGSESMSKNEEEDEEDDDEPQEIETIDVPEEDHTDQIKENILNSIQVVSLPQEAPTVSEQQQQQQQQQQPSQRDVLHADETVATNTTTYEIIAAPALKQARLSHGQTSVGSVSPIETSTALQSVGTDTKHRDLVTPRQFFTIANPPMQPASIPMSCYTTTPMPSQALQQPPQQQPMGQPQLQTQISPHFTFIPNAMANEADHNFFQSLVPDIQTMTMEQKRKLKIGILQLIDGILNT